MSVHDASECLAKLPMHKKYQCIYSDCCWSYSNTGNNGSAKKHYDTMTTAELEALPVKELSDKTCLLFMWVTCPLIPDALRVIQAWGFTYRTVFKCWTKRCKNGNIFFGTGWYSRPSVELLFVATKGSGVTALKTTNSERQEYASIPGRHSEKPEEIRRQVRDFLNVPNRLELFARSTCPGFDSWGLEMPGYFCEDPGTKEEALQAGQSSKNTPKA